MSKNLQIRMRVPTASSFMYSPPPIVFRQWLPLEDQHSISINHDGLLVTLWFDLQCVQSLDEVDRDKISRWLNVTVGMLNVDVHVKEISDELASFIYTERDWPRSGFTLAEDNPSLVQLKDEYASLGMKVLEAVLRSVNRLLSYFRNEKMQYWVTEYSLDFNRTGSYVNEFDARVRSDEYDWIRWSPPNEDIAVITSASPDSAVGEDEWPRVADFVRGNRRPYVVTEFLANASRLANEGYNRSALIEAVCALEAAVNDFVANPNLDSLLNEEFVKRIQSNSLPKLREKVGLRGTLNVLFPLLFREDVMSTDLLKDCQEAIDVRGTIVHNRQRQVYNEQAWKLLRSIKQMCRLLQSFTALSQE